MLDSGPGLDLPSANELSDEKLGAMLTIYVAVMGRVQCIPLGRPRANYHSTRGRSISC